jgi:hypothetical protein
MDNRYTYIKGLSIINQGNENQNHIWYHLTHGRMAIFKKTRNIKNWPVYGNRDSLCTDGWNVNWYSHYKNSMEVIKILKIELSYNPTILLWCVYLKEMKLVPWRDNFTTLFIAALRTIPTRRNNLRVHRWMNRKTKFGV